MLQILLVFILSSSLYCGSTLELSQTTLPANAGTNVTLSCRGKSGVNWIKGPSFRIHGKEDDPQNRMKIHANGDLTILGINVDDSNLYTCQDSDTNESIHSVLLQVINK